MAAGQASGLPIPWANPDEGRDADLSLFEDSVLGVRSEQPDRTARTSELAMLANGSLSRLEHLARRLEARASSVRREPLPSHGRMTVAILLEPGLRAIEDAAPDLVRHVRSVHSGP